MAVTNGNTNANVEMSEVLASRAKKLPASTQFAIVTCMPNIVYGATWGYAKYDEVKDRYEELKKDNNIICRKLRNSHKGYDFLIELNPTYLAKVANIIQPGLFNQKDLERVKEKTAEAYATFEKMAKNGSLKKFDRVGIYCINSSAKITIEGNSFPSFRVNLQTALKILSKYGYLVKTTQGFVPASSLCNVQGLNQVAQALVISPTETGVFMAIK